MTLSPKIIAAVDELARTGAVPTSVTVEDGPWRLTVQAEMATPVGLSCSGLELATTGGGEWAPDALRARADRLIGRLTYLMEPLALHEADPLAGEVRLRSQAPTPRGDRHAFYEIRLDRRGRVQFARYQFDADQRRPRPVPCQFTREVLERLVDDLTACLA